MNTAERELLIDMYDPDWDKWEDKMDVTTDFNRGDEINIHEVPDEELDRFAEMFNVKKSYGKSVDYSAVHFKIGDVEINLYS